ncbi:MAG: citrate lyase acyl carrier protein, partial [Thermoanaerobaculia bacterium]
MTEPVADVRYGEAGRTGDDIRSDLLVRIEPRTGGGIEIELASKVGAYYGEAIQRQCREVLRDLGVTDAVLRIDDRGALPFVIAARVEAAARRALLS